MHDQPFEARGFAVERRRSLEEIARCEAIIVEKARSLVGGKRPGLPPLSQPAFGHE